MAGTKAKMVLAICTRRRPEDLRRLLESIRDMAPPLSHTLDIVIVENDDQLSVGDIVSAVGLPYPVQLVCEPRVGLAFVRNRTLEIADDLSAQYLLGVDDDEWVDPDWLRAYERALVRLPHQHVFMGRYEFVYGPDLSVWRKPFQFERRFLGQQTPVYSTANYMITNKVFSTKTGLGLRFDLRYNFIGGEDSDLFMRLHMLHDLPAIYVPDALTKESISADRSSFLYVFRRRRRQMAVFFLTRQIIYAQVPGKGTIAAYRRAWGDTLRSAFRFVCRPWELLEKLIDDRRISRADIGDAVLDLAVILSFFDFVFKRFKPHYQSSQTSKLR